MFRRGSNSPSPHSQSSSNYGPGMGRSKKNWDSPVRPSASIKAGGMTRSKKDWGAESKRKAQPDFGLASKGDIRLTEHKTQEAFFEQIQQRYIFHCGSFPTVPALDEQFAAMSINANNPTSSPVRASAKPVDTSVLESILMDMRKLREGLLASNRVDGFTTSVYLFIARAAILMSHPESYFPSLRYILYSLHRVRPLSRPDVHEMASYLMLHYACSTQSFHDAYQIKVEFDVHDFRAEAVLRSLVTGNYWLFWSTKKLVDGYKVRIMEMAERYVRMNTLKAIGMTYMKVDVGFLQNITGREWGILKEEFNVGWQRDGDTIHVRKPRDKGAIPSGTPSVTPAATPAATPVKKPSEKSEAWTPYG